MLTGKSGSAAAAGIFVAAALAVCGAALLVVGPSRAPSFDAQRATLDQYCVGCHNRSEYAGDIAFDALDLADFAADLEIWERAARKLDAGMMPPPGEPRPDADESQRLVAWLEASIDDAYAAIDPDPGRVMARRLNRIEYENTIRDLLGVDFSAEEAFPPDDSAYGFDNIAEVLTVSPTLMQQYLAAAERIAARAVGGNPLPQPVLICDPDSGRECADRILTRLAYRAFRRPVEREEVSRLLDVFDEALQRAYSPRESLQFAITAVLVSPQFLFRAERDPAPGRIARISDFELASRLSYFLWRSMPDEELFRLAEEGALQNAEAIEAQVRRMIADPKAAALSKHFVGQWLETRSLAAVTRDADRFPEWGPELARAMHTETELFFDAVLRENRPISDFIDGRYTYLDERLARHYGIPEVEGEHFRRVELSGQERSGVFTHASVLTVTSYPNRTSVVLRGEYLLDNVLSSPLPGPPADVPGLDEASVGKSASLRTQMEAHRTNPTCASCHRHMDPLGFALENYGATGKWRADDGAFPIDASGVFPDGREFKGPAEMKALLLERMPDFTRGLAEKMSIYALGRGLESRYDRKVLRDIVARTAADGYRLQTMIVEIAKSAPFRERRGPATSRNDRN